MRSPEPHSNLIFADGRNPVLSTLIQLREGRRPKTGLNWTDNPHNRHMQCETDLSRDVSRELTVGIAERLIDRSRQTTCSPDISDAAGLIGQWWNKPSAPPDILLARAHVRQRLRDYHEALEDLREILEKFPDHNGARLTLIEVLKSLGRLNEAARESISLRSTLPPLVAATAHLGVASLRGQANGSFHALKARLDQDTHSSIAQKRQAASILGEIAVRLGMKDEAEQLFLYALNLGEKTEEVRCQYADLLLDQGRHETLRQFVATGPESTGLQLRLAKSYRTTSPDHPRLNPILRSLKSSLSRNPSGNLQAQFLRGFGVHASERERAYLALHVERNPGDALALAIRNWEFQKLPIDTLLVIEAAHAAGKPEKVDHVKRWIDGHGMEDQRLLRFL